jgi:hypothetical protein
MPETPSADFCRPVRTGYPILSPESRTNGRSPEVSSTAFHASARLGTPPRDVALALRLHQAVKRTFTFELSNMLGTQQSGGFEGIEAAAGRKGQKQPVLRIQTTGNC